MNISRVNPKKWREFFFVRSRIHDFVGFLPLSSFKNQINLMIFRGQVTIFNPHDWIHDFVLVFINFLPLFSFKNQINLMIFRGQVTIFNPHDYPDMTSGGVIDFLVSPMKHRSVELEAIVFYSTRNIIPYPLEKRDCVFQDEMTSFNMFYTYSDCIVDCKIDDIWNTCKCVPFFLPNRSKNRQWFYQS